MTVAETLPEPHSYAAEELSQSLLAEANARREELLENYKPTVLLIEMLREHGMMFKHIAEFLGANQSAVQMRLYKHQRKINKRQTLQSLSWGEFNKHQCE